MSYLTKTYRSIFLLLCIVLLGGVLRLYNLNWDQGFHLHPDERAIVMFTTPLVFPKTISEFLSPQSTWNPHFFAYGSFPIYFLKIAGNIASIVDPTYTTYDRINLLGRFLSVIFDIGTLYVLFLLAKKLFNENIGLLAAFFYAISVLSIQLSHFYAVDTPLTFFILLTLYQLISLYKSPTIIKSALVGLFFGLSLATKTSALVLIASIGMAIAIDFLLIFLKQPHKPHIWFPHLPKFLKRIIIDGIIIAVVTIITFIIFEPYAIIDFRNFWQQNLQQYQMTRDAFTFPYTLQYVGKIPYWHELKNIFLWGLGPILATLSFLGSLYISSLAIKQFNNKIIILLTFFWIYFLVVGNFSVGFMRYMLPLYPLLCIFASVFTYKIFLILKSYFLNHKYQFIILNSLFIILLLVWPLSFMHIYKKLNTRVASTDWINKNIPPGSTIATEHWDDGLPLFGVEKYTILTLTLYDPDTSEKWTRINEQLKQTDYMIIASNRLYTPLQKLTDCIKLPPYRCYPQTAAYYKHLFAGKNVLINAENIANNNFFTPKNKAVTFQKIAEFSIFPALEIGNWKLEIRDEITDESFTVYDHPKVMVLKKIIN